MKTKYLNPPQVIMLAFMGILLLAAMGIDMDMAGIISDALVKWAMNGVIVLSLIPMINVGAGRNFGMTIGLSAGLVGMIFALNARLTSWTGFFCSILAGMAVALVFGLIYAAVLNRLKLNEEIVGTFAGYSFIPIMNLFYTFVPVTNRQMLYPIGGQGLRPKVNLENYFGQILDRLWQIEIGGVVIPLGLLLFFFGIGLLLWLFSKTRTGLIFTAIAENEKFARLTGIRVNRYRTIAIVMSTVIAAVGVVVYSQSYGILHLYDGPFMMSFPAVSAIVIGGASPKKATVTNALIGTFLYQTPYLLSIPVANALLIPEMAEILRTIITSGIILYAFIFERKDARHEVHKA